MTAEDLITAIRAAQAANRDELPATMQTPIRGVRHVVLRNLDGHVNGNPHDIWIESVSGKKVLGRMFLGSKRRRTPDLEGWESRLTIVMPANLTRKGRN